MQTNRATNMHEYSSQAAFKDLMAAIGFLMFHWSLLEHDLGEEIIRLRSKSGDLAPSRNRLRSSASERLAEWRALQSRRRRKDAAFQQAVEDLGERIQTLTRVRNLVTHGFVSAEADPDSAAEPWIMCTSTISGVGPPDSRLALRDLEAAIEQMEQCRAELVELGADQP
jgi:hypothetical protein